MNLFKHVRPPTSSDITDCNETITWSERPFLGRVTPAGLILASILLLSLALHFYNLQSIGNSNEYYTAAVKSMLTSWKNFFFVSAEPGGSVTVDKPPLGLWIEAAFAAVLGVSGLAVVLPNLLAGVLSVLMLYFIVKRSFGVEAGLAAALVFAVTPVSLAVDRNNTMDGILIFTLILAAWVFLDAAETGRLKSLLLGALIVGLAFNVKMLQAFLPLPAFYAAYFLFAKKTWSRKFLELGLASIILVVVSLAWVAAVDLVPAQSRPYVGSTRTNSEWELVTGYNGINRLVGQMGGPPGKMDDPDRAAFQPPPPQAGGTNTGSALPAPPPSPSGGGVPGGGPGMGETGERGFLRFFKAPLAKEMSWLLPFALLAVLICPFAHSHNFKAVTSAPAGWVLWGGWLLTCLVFFSLAGFFHNYYLAMLSPALAATVGAGIAQVKKLGESSPKLAGIALNAAAGLTLLFQYYLAGQYGLDRLWIWISAASFIAGLVLIFLGSKLRQSSTPIYTGGMVITLLSMLMIPAAWSVRTVASNSSAGLPSAYAGDHSQRDLRPNFAGGGGAGPSGVISREMLEYLKENTTDIEYLAAVPDSYLGSRLVLETGRAVFFIGGFTGADAVIDADGLAKLVGAGRIRYVFDGGMRPGRSAISDWLASNCQPVSGFANQPSNQPGPGGNSALSLYRCDR